MLHLESVKEVSIIMGEALIDCGRDTVKWLGELAARADAKMCDYGDE